ncbi:hypothetical protein LX99_04261 [Mucilaginibacter oryzae]|uniref:Uncharacterized protein n=1 Tax=Mucilaginibacter oryzae TaxID=468058 RepID=A0A316H2F8_9SPHI|nr:hypothetical protein [Mucilaginibacter oryzae]PWK72931.1 hypothetical protein LX99_04261 [Mucilaginibacter oryzae]
MKIAVINLLIFSLASLGFTQAQAQFLGGFFSQQKQQRKLMAEQIAQYELYLSAIKTGYHVAETGLNAVQELKNGTFNLHEAYFNSLEQVNPLIQSDPKGKTIADLNAQTLKRFSDEWTWQQQQKQLTTSELSYFQKVQANIAAKCQLDINELTDVLTPGRLQLTDAQRLGRLDKIYERMKDKFAFAGSFTGKCRKLATGRKNSRQDKDQLKKLYGIQ